ncbi:MAG: bifunctional precorrin-2 dehydrogenase/sirohydrochlorin ferrochelatase [Ferruginibacter sp.]
MQSSNNLFPVFLKLENLRLLIVGGGYVGMEKLQAVISNSPATIITIVALQISDAIKEVAKQYPGITLSEKKYTADDLAGHDIVIAAINDPGISKQVVEDANCKKILVNAADKPELCDFYLGSVVKKGNLKIAISTNGKSPTIAKRVKEFLNNALPEEIDELLDNMESIRNKMSGDFTEKVKQLNEITKTLSK